MACDGAAVFKGLLFVMCVVCLVYKRYTDNEALKVFYQLEKLSREWPLLNNVTWDENGALLADLTFGGFAIVTLGLLVGAVTGELRRIRNLVCFYQVLGCIMFLVVGGLCLAAIDSVPHHLVDNAIVLGVLSILTGLLFLADLAVTGSRKLTTQDKKSVLVVSPPKAVEAKKPQEKKVDETKSKKTAGNGVLKELRSSLKRKKTVEDLDGRGVVVEKERSVEFEKVKDTKTEIERVERPESRSGIDHDDFERSAVERTGFERSGVERTGFERSGVERTGFERSAVERTGFERSAVERPTAGKSEFERSGVDRSRLARDEVDNTKFDEPSAYDRSGDEYRQYGRRRLDNRGFPRSASVDSGRFSSEQRFRSEFLDAEKDRWLERDGERHVSVVEGTYDPRRSRPTSMMEVELDEHYLQPRDYYIEKRVSREERLLRLQDQKVSSSSARQHDPHFSDDEYNQAQLPSVSFLLAERGRKMLPSVKSSPLERLQEVTSSSSANGKPRYYYNSNRDPASGASAPPSPHSPGNPPTPRTPGYVLHTASNWQDPDKVPSTVSDRIQHWFKSRPPGKAP